MTQSAPLHAPSAEDIKSTNLLCVAVVPRVKSTTFPLYWVQFAAGTDQEQLLEALREVLTDPLQEELWHASSNERLGWMKRWAAEGYRWWAERQFLPGVTDNLAHTVHEALTLKGCDPTISVASGTGFLFPKDASKGSGSHFDTDAELEVSARYSLYHPITDRFAVHDLATPEKAMVSLLNFPIVRLPQPKPFETISLDLTEDELEALSKNRVLALSREEMRAIRQHYSLPATKKARQAEGMPEMPTDVELEIIAQTWSEHCKHKIFNATISHTDFSKPAANQKSTIKSLYKSYIQAVTKELMSERPDLLSVFEDNSGVVKWNEDQAVCFKVETHNSPSALEPYGGALTGILGVNRDVLGTGLGARPLFNTDVFCFAYPSADLPNRPKLLPAKTILDGVRKGVEDGGNKSGIPTVNGAIFFDKDFRAKPLVFCGTGGILPLEVAGLCGYKKHTAVGDTIVMAGGRVGKDGIHGATFSSESLHEGSPVSAVQIGDPFTQKRLLDFTIEARDAGLISGITDNGAGGLSSSVGEMAGATNGATIELDHVPIKYPGLQDWEIVVSESQERMTLATKDFAALKALADKHSVEISAIGTFHDKGCFEVTRGGKPVAVLDLKFLHSGNPTLQLESEWRPSQITMNTGAVPADLSKMLLRLLGHPNICSREKVIRQYDHEVQGLSVIKPLMGTKQKAACDSAVLTPVYGEQAGLAVSNGLNPRLSAHDCYLMAVCAVDEAIRNTVCVGADPMTVSVLDNFCWPDPVFTDKNPRGKVILAQLVRACQGLYEACSIFKAPLISGKDSMKNDFDDGVIRLSIPPTLLVSAIAKVHDIETCVTMEFKESGDLIYLLTASVPGLAASHYEELVGWQSPMVPTPNLQQAAEMYKRLHKAISAGMINSAHDLSEGGLAVALAESMIGSHFGASIYLDALNEFSQKQADETKTVPASKRLIHRIDTVLFGEGPSRILVTVPPARQDEWEALFTDMDCIELGTVTDAPFLLVQSSVPGGSTIETLIKVSSEELEAAWHTELPFDSGGH